jgi:perosamine synthetase
MYTVKLRGVDRTRFIDALRSQGIAASVHFDPPVHLQPYYAQAYGVEEGDLSVTESLSQSIVSLPMYPALEQSQLDEIVRAVQFAVDAAAR